MKIAILGYGKMGKEIEKAARERKHTIELIIDEDNVNDFTIENISKCDVAIDFSIPESAYNNILKCFEANVPIVSGTTGWLDKYDEIIERCKKQNQTFFYASNYSLGVNLFRVLNKYLASLMNDHPDFRVRIEETHHTQKADAPSGTAITLADDILPLINSKTSWELDRESSPDKLKISAFREPEVFGIHKIIYDSDVDTIEIGHYAKSRKGFALGAVKAAEFISGKKGAFTMKDLLNIDI